MDPNLSVVQPQDELKERLFRYFRGFTWGETVRVKRSWLWDHGYDIKDTQHLRRWVCKLCILNNRIKPESYVIQGL
jgi:hypothetical protein